MSKSRAHEATSRWGRDGAAMGPRWGHDGSGRGGSEGDGREKTRFRESGSTPPLGDRPLLPPSNPHAAPPHPRVPVRGHVRTTSGRRIRPRNLVKYCHFRSAAKEQRRWQQLLFGVLLHPVREGGGHAARPLPRRNNDTTATKQSQTDEQTTRTCTRALSSSSSCSSHLLQRERDHEGECARGSVKGRVRADVEPRECSFLGLPGAARPGQSVDGHLRHGPRARTKGGGRSGSDGASRPRRPSRICRLVLLPPTPGGGIRILA
jgi:hypothetical protein